MLKTFFQKNKNYIYLFIALFLIKILIFIFNSYQKVHNDTIEIIFKLIFSLAPFIILSLFIKQNKINLLKYTIVAFLLYLLFFIYYIQSHFFWFNIVYPFLLKNFYNGATIFLILYHIINIYIILSIYYINIMVVTKNLTLTNTKNYLLDKILIYITIFVLLHQIIDIKFYFDLSSYLMYQIDYDNVNVKNTNFIKIFTETFIMIMIFKYLVKIRK